MDYYQQALKIRHAEGDRSGEAITLLNIGDATQRLGQPQTALDYYDQALPMFKAVGDRLGESVTLNNIGGIYSTLGQPQKALDYYNQVLTMTRTLGDRSGEARTLNNIGSIYTNLGQFPQALDYLNQALPIFQETGNRHGEAVTLNNIGGIYNEGSQPQKALAYYQQALILRRAIGDRAGEATTLGNIGGAYSHLKQVDKALQYYQQVLPMFQSIGDRAGAAATLSNLGWLYRSTEKIPQAIAAWEQSLTLKLAIRSSLNRSNRSAFLEADAFTGYWLVNLLIDQHQPQRAYEWVNLITTADLADYSRLIAAKVANPKAQQALEQWNQEYQQLERLQQQLQERFSLKLSQQVQVSQAQLNQQGEEISRRFPEVAELFETTPTDIAQLQSHLSPGTVVLHPVLLSSLKGSPDAMALFLVTRDRVTVTKVPLQPHAFDRLLTLYRRQIQDYRTQAFKPLSEQLYDLLIRPIEAQIQAMNPTQLSIIATGKLRYIPFETLFDHQSGKYLIEKYPINNLTRLSIRALQQPANPHTASILGLGNPFPNDNRTLPAAELEVKTITPLLPKSLAYLGKQATLENFKLQAPRFSILHLATHGCFQPAGCPDLQMTANTLLFADRNLNIADAALLGLQNTDLVVLSACQTAVQANSHGEEFTGIAYLFERAGARSVIASLWTVDDQATGQLMIQFYRNLRQGMGKGESLRQAKISQMQLHPYYWSPFILIGDTR
nr:CHAT domain-containing protein [Neosynechococcus sphagnicola]